MPEQTFQRRYGMTRPPPMRVVVKGAFASVERHVQLDVLRRHDALVRHGTLHGRAWWKPHNRRWTGSSQQWATWGLVAVTAAASVAALFTRFLWGGVGAG